VSYTTSSVDVQGAFYHHKQYGRTGFTPFHHRTIFINVRMPNLPASKSGQSGTEMKKTAGAERVQNHNKGTQSGTGTLRYRTEMSDARGPMSTASALIDADAQQLQLAC
jgi:hypothetical protein